MINAERIASELASTLIARAVMATGNETGGLFGVVAVTLPPHDTGLPVHRHAQHTEGCYVVEGTLAFTCDDITTTLTAGASVLVPPGVLHTYWNPIAAPTTILLIYRPGATAAEVDALALGGLGVSA